MKYIFPFLFFCIFTSTGVAQVLQLKIKGENASETSIIDSLGYQKEHKNYSEVKQEIEQTFFQIQKSGYIDAISSEVKKEQDSLFEVTIHLNDHYPYIKVFHQLNKAEKQLLSRYTHEITEEYFILPIYRTEKVLEELIMLKSKTGDAFTSLKLSEIKKTGDLITAKLLWKETQVRRLDSIIIKGYEKFRASFIKYHLGIKEGQIFQKEKLTKQAAKVKSLPFVSEIKPPEVLFTTDSTFAYLYLKKENNNTFDGFLGFSNSEKDKFVVSGNVNLQLSNNLNFGEKLLIHYKNNGSEILDFKTSLELPFLFKTPVGALARLELFKQDSTYLNVSQALQLNYTINSQLALNTGYTAHSSTALQGEESFSSNFVKDFSSQYFTIGGYFQSLNTAQILDPVITIFNLKLSWGQRETDVKVPQQKIDLQGAHNFFISKKSSVYINSSIKIIFSEDYLENELFRLGGISTVRGFIENSIKANFFSTLQTEFRYLLSPNLNVHSIMDFGYFEQPILAQEENLFGYGVGFTFNTKSGILRLDLANGSFGIHNLNFSNPKVHLSLSVHF